MALLNYATKHISSMVFPIVFLLLSHRAIATIQHLFEFTGDVQTFTIPFGVSMITIDLQGASGGYINGLPNLPGFGARVQDTLTVVGGTTWYVYIGGQPEIAPISEGFKPGGYNGGRRGYSVVNGGASGGGGSSDIRTVIGDINSRIAVAGGGGGTALRCINHAGHGGFEGTTGCGNDMPLQGGGGGTQTAGGLPTGGNAGPGELHRGGQAGSNVMSNGGGGGGLYGGAGGNARTGGGGGSSMSSGGGGDSAEFTTGFKDGHGVLVISYDYTPTSQPSGQPSYEPTGRPSSQPSSEPTGQPTMRPTGQPSNQPSSQPSGLPSVRPSGRPSSQPSGIPSSLPSGQPTGKPSRPPTGQPISAPSSQPSCAPSSQPSAQPTVTPTCIPSTQPSTLPTVQPSSVPTVQPTSQPASSPSLAPTTVPSSQPTNRPSAQPSAAPSGQPSCQPTSAPSLCPTIRPTAQPTAGPSEQPSSEPNVQPSVIPSAQPSLRPNGNPSGQPSASPSAQPSLQPTGSPSVRPSVQPSSVPSAQPSRTSSSQPSAVPSMQPSGRPTGRPSAQPSVQPTDSPSVRPSVQPSSVPSTQPSALPSCQPTGTPSTQPSGNPTALPSSQPSTQPTVSPSASPSVLPSSVPSTLPSASPSSQPSASPSVQPSGSPSSQPSSRPLSPPSTQPSALPSAQPSSVPSKQPSGRPSSQPSAVPSMQPTDSPTGRPSAHASVKPTTQPSASPSNQPSAAPSMQPSGSPTGSPSSQPSLQPTGKPSGMPPVQPSLSGCPSSKPAASPGGSPTSQPSVCPSLHPGLQSTSQPSLQPSTRSSAVPSVQPQGWPTLHHGGGTLPSNYTLSVVGGGGAKFKFVLPFYFMSDTAVGDGFADVVLSIPSIGSSTVIYGQSASFWAAHGGTISATQIKELSEGFELEPAVGSDVSGRSVANAGDVNGDGYDDLIIGVPRIATCYVVFGTSSGFVNMTHGFTIYGARTTDHTCWSVNGAGDVNNDGFDDVIIGAPYAGTLQEGVVYVLYGQANNIRNIHLSYLGASQGFTVHGARAFDHLGLSVSGAGDVNGDGVADVLVSAILTSEFHQGSAHVIYGQGTTAMSDVLVANLDSSAGMTLVGRKFSWFGYSVSGAGDVNNDSYADVIIGQPRTVMFDAASYVIYGAAGERRTPATVFVNNMTASYGLTITGSGAVVSSVGDINNDGYAEVMVGDGYGSDNTGCVVYLSPTVPTAAPTSQPSVSDGPPYDDDYYYYYHDDDDSTAASTPSPSPTPVRSVAPSNVNDTTLPSVLPTTRPSRRRSRKPTKEHTAIPSVLPTHTSLTTSPTIKSRSPTGLPVCQPTAVPITHVPMRSTRPTKTRAPSTAKPTTAMPTVFGSSAYLVVDGTAVFSVGGFYHLTSDVSVCVINSSQPVIIFADLNETADVPRRTRIYDIVPIRSGFVEIHSFSAKLDLIDLRRFVTIQAYSQLNLTAGSVIVNLPQEQKVILTKLTLTDITANSFIFHESLTSSRGHMSSTRIAVIVSSTVAVVIFLWLLLKFYRWLETRKAAKIMQNQPKLVSPVVYIPDSTYHRWEHSDSSVESSQTSSSNSWNRSLSNNRSLSSSRRSGTTSRIAGGNDSKDDDDEEESKVETDFGSLSSSSSVHSESTWSECDADKSQRSSSSSSSSSSVVSQSLHSTSDNTASKQHTILLRNVAMVQRQHHHQQQQLSLSSFSGVGSEDGSSRFSSSCSSRTSGFGEDFGRYSGTSRSRFNSMDSVSSDGSDSSEDSHGSEGMSEDSLSKQCMSQCV